MFDNDRVRLVYVKGFRRIFVKYFIKLGILEYVFYEMDILFRIKILLENDGIF